MILDELICGICKIRFWMTPEEIAKFAGGNPNYAECPDDNCVGDINFTGKSITDEEAKDGD